MHILSFIAAVFLVMSLSVLLSLTNFASLIHTNRFQCQLQLLYYLSCDDPKSAVV